MEDLLKRIREKQRTMQVLYDKQTVTGEKFEIPWDNHLPVRIILNFPQHKKRDKYPVYINIHGGGYIEGDASTMDSFCQKLADALGILAVNLNYRLAPDFTFPYQLDEIEVLYNYLLAHKEEMNINSDLIAIGGFSAGGALGIGSVIKNILERKENYCCCVCGYPLTSALAQDVDFDSEYPATDEEMSAAMAYYYHGEENNILNSPLHTEKDILKKMPSSIIFTCGKDSLGAMGRRFAKKLADCGVSLKFKEFKNAYHGFVEINRPDYFADDLRKTDEQKLLTAQAEQFIIDGLHDVFFQDPSLDK